MTQRTIFPNEKLFEEKQLEQSKLERFLPSDPSQTTFLKYLSLGDKAILAQTCKNIYSFFQDELIAAQNSGELAIIHPRKKDIFQDELLQSDIPTLNEDKIKKYIANFIKQKKTAKVFGYENVETVYQRIASITHLREIVETPIMLMIAMHTLPYLEAFYSSQPINAKELPVVYKDLLHIFTHLLITDMAHVIRLSNNGLLHIGRFSIYEAILKYSMAAAKFLNIYPKISEAELLVTIDPRKLANRHLFCTKFNLAIFKTDDNYQLIKFGREGCIFINQAEQNESLHYSFIHQEFLDYFATLLPQSSRRDAIITYLKNNNIFENHLSPRFTKNPHFNNLSIQQKMEKYAVDNLENRSLMKI